MFALASLAPPLTLFLALFPARYVRETTVADDVSAVPRPGTVPTPDKRATRAANMTSEETATLINSISMDRDEARSVSRMSMAESRRSRASYLSRPRTQQMMKVKSEGVIPQRYMKYVRAKRAQQRAPQLALACARERAPQLTLACARERNSAPPNWLLPVLASATTRPPTNSSVCSLRSRLRYSGQNLIVKTTDMPAPNKSREPHDDSGDGPPGSAGVNFHPSLTSSLGGSLDTYGFASPLPGTPGGGGGRNRTGSVASTMMSRPGTGGAGGKPPKGTLASKWYNVGRFVKVL
jgi:hypothetical protein